MSLLRGYKVLDFSTLLPGPFATMMLADLGAEVLRVESFTRLDSIRQGKQVDGGVTAAHGYLNRSKSSIALDLKKQEAVDIVKELVKEYDIVLEQFRPGVMERLGLGFEALRAINPRLIYCSITGYGQTGPYHNRPGHDNNYLSIAGINEYSRRKGSPPSPHGFHIADIAGGSLHSVIGMLAALLHRERTGEGQYIDVSMTDAAFVLNTIHGAGYLACGVEPQAEVMRLNGGIFYDYYETKDGRYFSVGSLEPQFRKLLCEAIGGADLLPLSFSESPDDVQAFKNYVRNAFRAKTFAEWTAIFQEIEACVEPVLTFAEACEHPQLKAREMIVDVPKPDGTTQRQFGFPIKFSAAQPEYKHIGSKLGEHSIPVLKSLGYTDEQIATLKETEVFAY
ncbi:CoA transferase [Brevibacillus sp. HB1.4B]|uniref:CaiB/BaiF CoA transferase family protein n=1 Tax=Brevibacillus sp. HB1.4B TaxID=2738845 RepID=UPI00156AB8B9|nr:CaiB/BaiF CoA-transferase family protein [Brevibacillus sp. HB1.4B]NRS15378.1 CoA transferase [Brevibacillus sp. HB1.4B]